MSRTDLVPLDEWRRELELRTDIGEIRRLHDLAESIRKYGESEEIRHRGAIAKLWAAYRAGVLLAALEREQGQRTDLLPDAVSGSSPYRQELLKADLDERQAQRWQELAALGEDHLETYIASDAETKEVTLRRAIRISRDKNVKLPAIRGAHKPDLRQGRFQDALVDIPEKSIDAILTDPPYEKSALGELRDLAAFARRVLKPTGVMVILYGQAWLPEAIAALADGPPWRWCGCYLTPGPGYVSQARRVQSNWKPLLIYGSGPRCGDLIQSTGDDKTHHIWGQNADAWIEIVARFVDKTLANPVVCDPFLGAGTTALAAISAGCRFIGCDADADAFETARERLVA